MLRLISVVSFSLLLSISISQAAWGPLLQNAANTFDAEYNDNFVYTLIGACRFPKVSYRSVKSFISERQIKNPYFDSDQVTIYRGLQKQGKKIQKRPVMVFIPGAFTNIGSKQPMRYVKEFWLRGFHVVVLPNPWGTDFVQNKPNHNLGHIQKEIEASYYTIRQAIAELKEMDVIQGEVSLYGISYGGFISAAIAAIDSEQRTPVITGQTTVLSPPYDLWQTLNQFEDLQNLVKETMDDISTARLLAFSAKMCRLKNESKLSERDLLISKGIIFYAGFHWDLIESARLYDEIWNIGKVPKPGLFGRNRAYKKWKKELTFKTFLQNHAPENLPILKSEIGKISYWLDKAWRHGNHDVRVLVSDDDFLNSPGDWAVTSLYRDVRSTSRLILLPKGGHYGYRADDWFGQFLDVMYPIQNQKFFENLVGQR